MLAIMTERQSVVKGHASYTGDFNAGSLQESSRARRISLAPRAVTALGAVLSATLSLGQERRPAVRRR